MDPNKLNIGGGWKEFLSPFIVSKEFDQIYAKLKEEHAKGVTIYPASTNFWKPFNLCPYEDLKVILIADGPYNYTATTKQGTFVLADGLALSSASYPGRNKVLDECWYRGIEVDLHDGINLNLFINSDLSFLAEQGVLLLNSAFTTPTKGDSHFDIWKPFMKYLIKEIFANHPADLVYILMGEEANSFKFNIFPGSYVLKCEHPEVAVRERREWDFNNIFSKTNSFLKKYRNLEILWAEELPAW